MSPKKKPQAAQACRAVWEEEWAWITSPPPCFYLRVEYGKSGNIHIPAVAEEVLVTKAPVSRPVLLTLDISVVSKIIEGCDVDAKPDMRDYQTLAAIDRALSTDETGLSEFAKAKLHYFRLRNKESREALLMMLEDAISQDDDDSESSVGN